MSKVMLVDAEKLREILYNDLMDRDLATEPWAEEITNQMMKELTRELPKDYAPAFPTRMDEVDIAYYGGSKDYKEDCLAAFDGKEKKDG